MFPKRETTYFGQLSSTQKSYVDSIIFMQWNQEIERASRTGELSGIHVFDAANIAQAREGYAMRFSEENEDHRMWQQGYSNQLARYRLFNAVTYLIQSSGDPANDPLREQRYATDKIKTKQPELRSLLISDAAKKLEYLPTPQTREAAYSFVDRIWKTKTDYSDIKSGAGKPYAELLPAAQTLVDVAIFGEVYTQRMNAATKKQPAPEAGNQYIQKRREEFAKDLQCKTPNASWAEYKEKLPGNYIKKLAFIRQQRHVEMDDLIKALDNLPYPEAERTNIGRK